MTEDDRVRWDRRYSDRAPLTASDVALPAVFQPFEDAFPSEGVALDLACGAGGCTVWLARRGMDVCGCDVSPVAIARARELAQRSGYTDRCEFRVVDLDAGLPAGDHADLLLCNKFRDPRLDVPIIERLAPGGLLAISALSEVDAQPGPFRAKRGELTNAFAALDIIAAGEAHGEAWLLGRRMTSS